ncbi:MAG: prepilin-type N-terminal cleavage/methylation domain-containing protein [Aquabacterium sp.]|uniref:type IV pilin protein n=1 Tax=Aquabacterium sp. TaxID=1872578 RepID=UPI002A36D7F8|nr:prepilin-type N-terminal cleavage/methylation domain-containing protein [Aquabacterium sp.]MDX9844127.1 prepilin-type N-terminal cleavage/methylation domain-containing protein [Aquabacterium sp.]
MTACNTPHPTLPRTHQGFTLIEVMITVAIIGILAAVAYPSYTDYIRKSHIQEAFSNLSTYRARLEQYYQDNRAFAASATATTCGGAADTTLTAAELGAEIEYFTYTCTPSDSGQGYLITATGSSGAAPGNTYTLDHTGARATTSFKGTSVTAACWLINGSC